jgi:hypothetical protein
MTVQQFRCERSWGRRLVDSASASVPREPRRTGLRPRSALRPGQAPLAVWHARDLHVAGNRPAPALPRTRLQSCANLHLAVNGELPACECWDRTERPTTCSRSPSSGYDQGVAAEPNRGARQTTGRSEAAHRSTSLFFVGQSSPRWKPEVATGGVACTRRRLPRCI